MNSLNEWQKEMRDNYALGAIGALVSGTIWIISSVVVNLYDPQKGILTLFFGGMLIFPLSMMAGKLMRIKGDHQKDNPLGKLAMEGTIWMIMCIPLAYGASLVRAEWFFLGMMLIIGGRYLTFASIYGTRIYWILGGVLGLTTFLLFSIQANSFVSALAGGLIEVIFGVILFVIYKSEKTKAS